MKIDRCTALRDLLEERIRDDRPAAGHHDAIAELTAVLTTALPSCGHETDSALVWFFDAFCQLAAAPTCSAARERVVRAAEVVADRFLAFTRSLATTRRRADHELRRAVADVNALTGQIAALNGDLRSAPTRSTSATTSREQLRQRLHELSHLVNIDVVPQCDGTVDVSFGPRRPLVLGGSAVPLTEGWTPSMRYMTLSSGGIVVSGDITSGRVGGLLHVRDSLFPRYELQLDTLAHAFVARVNALHLAGVDATGAPARELFVPIATMSGAAGAVSVQPTVAANPMLVAAAGIGSGGGSRAALAIAALRHRAGDGGTLSLAEMWAHIVGGAARDAQAACLERQSRGALVRQMEALHDSLSGISRPEDDLGAHAAGSRDGEISVRLSRRVPGNRR